LGMPHLKVNRKRDVMLNLRHDEIERDNMLMLYKMHESARKPDLSVVHRSSSLPALRCPGGPAQQREYDRIMQENHQMLNRLRNAQGEINMRRYAAQYEKTAAYVRLGCEYPPPLLRRTEKPRKSPGATLQRLPDDAAPSEAAPHEDPEEFDGLRYVLKENRLVEGHEYYVEMATDGEMLAISIRDEADDGYELVVDADHHQQLQQETAGDYSVVADRLTIQDGQLLVADPPPLGGFVEALLADNGGAGDVEEGDAVDVAESQDAVECQDAASALRIPQSPVDSCDSRSGVSM